MLYKLRVVSEYVMELTEKEYDELCACPYPEAFLREENLKSAEIDYILPIRE